MPAGLDLPAIPVHFGQCPQLSATRTDGPPVEITGADHEREYRARQIRLGIWIAVGVTGLAMVRIAAAWDVGHEWLLLTGAAVVVQLPLLRLPWNRLVRSPHLGTALSVWWLAELVLLTGFTSYDQAAGLGVFPVGAALLATSAGTIASPRSVIALGGASFAGYFIVAAAHPDTSSSLIGVSVGLTAAVVWLCRSTAANRHKLDTARERDELRTEALLENASDAIIAIGLQGEVVYASSSVRTVLGYEPSWLNPERDHAPGQPRHHQRVDGQPLRQPAGLFVADRVEGPACRRHLDRHRGDRIELVAQPDPRGGGAQRPGHQLAEVPGTRSHPAGLRGLLDGTAQPGPLP